MKARTLLLLVAAAVLAIGIAMFMQSNRKPQTEVRDQAQSMMPALRDHVNDVNAITLTGAESKPIATLKRGPEGWTIAERSGYPADLSKIRAFLLKLDGAKLVEPKTSNPQRYADIGVDDVKGAGAKGVMVELGGLTPPQKLIIGTHNESGGGTFVRRDGETQSWLASGNLVPATNVAEWEIRDITTLPLNRWQSVAITAPTGKTVKIYKENAEDQSFRADDVPKGRELDDASMNGAANMLGALRIDDALAAKDVAPGEKIYKVDFAGFDGLVVNATGWMKDEKSYAQFTASLDAAKAAAKIDADQAAAKAAADKAPADPAAKGAADAATAAKGPAEAPKSAPGADAGAASAKPPVATDPAKDRQEKLDALNKEVAALNKTFSGWTFVMPAYNFGAFTKTMDTLVKPLPKPEAAKAGGPPQPGMPPGGMPGMPPGMSGMPPGMAGIPPGAMPQPPGGMQGMAPGAPPGPPPGAPPKAGGAPAIPGKAGAPAAPAGKGATGTGAAGK